MHSLDIQDLNKDLVGELAGSVDGCLDKPSQGDLVSFLAEVPVSIQSAMTSFVESHPNWDQYRLIEAALAGFLVQNGLKSRQVTRLYLDKMFCSKYSDQDL